MSAPQGALRAVPTPTQQEAMTHACEPRNTNLMPHSTCSEVVCAEVCLLKLNRNAPMHCWVRQVAPSNKWRKSDSDDGLKLALAKACCPTNAANLINLPSVPKNRMGLTWFMGTLLWSRG